jgi:pyridoxine 4-dehydrogenase
VTTAKPGGFGLLGERRVARIGYGAMQLEKADRAAATAVLRAAIEHGVNYIDTAQFYGAGACNALIRDALAPYPDDLLLATKVGAESSGGGLVAAQRPEQLRAQVVENLAALGIDQLAVVNLRRMDASPGIVAEGEQVVDLDSQLAELVALRAEGKIGGIGLSNVDVDQLRQCLAAEVVCVQNSHSVLDRSAEPVLDVCREHGLAWVPFFPLGSAFTNRPKVIDDATVIAAAKALGVTPAQVGLAWELAHYEGTLLIPGTVDRAHLADNLAVGDVRLTAKIMSDLDALAHAAHRPADLD